MKITIIAVGHKQPAWVDGACDDYLRRIPRDLCITLREIKPEARQGKNRAQLLAAEKIRILAALPPRALSIVLDEQGEDLTTQQFATHLEEYFNLGMSIFFIIGSADGIDPELKEKASARLRLSSLTLPHGLARILLCEQLYRAISIMKNHPYHREG